MEGGGAEAETVGEEREAAESTGEGEGALGSCPHRLILNCGEEIAGNSCG